MPDPVLGTKVTRKGFGKVMMRIGHVTCQEHLDGIDGTCVNQRSPLAEEDVLSCFF